MKKLFTLIAGAFAALSVNAQTVVYSWESPAGTPVETGGKIAYVNGDGDRLNYANGAKDDNGTIVIVGADGVETKYSQYYWTICLNGKKANIADAAASANAGHMVITLDKALEGNETIEMTAYYNKGEEKSVSAYILFKDGVAVSSSTGWQDILAGGKPTTESITVPADAAGCTTISLTRDAAQTNLFITKLVITRAGGEVVDPGTEEPVAGETEIYKVVDAENALKAEWVSNPNVEEESVVELDVTPSVHLKAISGCISGFTDGPLVDGGLPKKYDNTWGLGNNKTNELPEGYDPMYFVNGKGVAFVDYGTEEVVTDGTPTGNFRPTYTYYVVDGSNGLPINGVRYILTPKTAGVMKVMIWNNKGNRNVFVVNGDSKVALAPADVNYSGFVNGNKADGVLVFHENMEKVEGKEYCPQAGVNSNQAMWGWLTFNVEAGVPYWVFGENAQLGFGGIEFTAPETDGIESVQVVAPANNIMYNLSGQVVDKSYRGVVIMNGKKFFNK